MAKKAKPDSRPGFDRLETRGLLSTLAIHAIPAARPIHPVPTTAVSFHQVNGAGRSPLTRPLGQGHQIVTSFSATGVSTTGTLTRIGSVTATRGVVTVQTTAETGAGRFASFSQPGTNALKLTPIHSGASLSGLTNQPGIRTITSGNEA